jgi:hypothetical protein
MVTIVSYFLFGSTAPNPFVRSVAGEREIGDAVASNIRYYLNADSTELDGVEFELNTLASSVRIRFSADSTTFFTCRSLSSYRWYCETHGQAVSGVKELRLVALSQ